MTPEEFQQKWSAGESFAVSRVVLTSVTLNSKSGALQLGLFREPKLVDALKDLGVLSEDVEFRKYSWADDLVPVYRDSRGNVLQDLPTRDDDLDSWFATQSTTGLTVFLDVLLKNALRQQEPPSAETPGSDTPPT